MEEIACGGTIFMCEKSVEEVTGRWVGFHRHCPLSGGKLAIRVPAFHEISRRLGLVCPHPLLYNLISLCILLFDPLFTVIVIHIFSLSVAWVGLVESTSVVL